MNQDTVTKLLRPGEQILWSSMSNPGKLMDEKNKQRNTRWFIIVGAVFAVLMFLYVRACIRAGTNVFSVVTLVFVLVAGIIFLDPVTTLKRLRKVEYAITTERVIVSSTSTNFSIPRSKAAPCRSLTRTAAFPRSSSARTRRPSPPSSARSVSQGSSSPKTKRMSPTPCSTVCLTRRKPSEFWKPQEIDISLSFLPILPISPGGKGPPFRWNGGPFL